MKKFAIVIVNYNCFNDIKETIGSLLKFDRKIFDIFLVDNNSDKDNLNQIEKYSLENKVFLLKSDRNLGFAGGNNLAINLAIRKDYPYIFLLNPDTLIEDKNFFKFIEQKLVNENIDVIGPLIKYYPEKDKIYFAGGFVNKFTGLTRMNGKKNKDIGQYNKDIECDFITGCAIIIKRKVFQKIGLLPEEYFLYFEESDFCMKAKNAGFKIVFTPSTFLYHKVSSSIGYLSNTYIYYMIRNQKIFSKKYVKPYYLPIFWTWYFFVWCLGYTFLSVKRGNLNGIKCVLNGSIAN